MLLPSGPVVMTPAMNNNMQPLAFPVEFRNLPPVNGYQAAHQRYVEFKRRLSGQAYAYGPTAEVVIIKFWMKTQAPGRSRMINARLRAVSITSLVISGSRAE
jgi:hypothetical protein